MLFREQLDQARDDEDMTIILKQKKSRFCFRRAAFATILHRDIPPSLGVTGLFFLSFRSIVVLAPPDARGETDIVAKR